MSLRFSHSLYLQYLLVHPLVYRMLEDNKDEHLVSWSPVGDSFTVKDMNEFTKVILPRMFKHSNFASFVRQLNKYDFHKIKNEEAPGDSSQVRLFFLSTLSNACSLDI